MIPPTATSMRSLSFLNYRVFLRRVDGVRGAREFCSSAMGSSGRWTLVGNNSGAPGRYASMLSRNMIASMNTMFPTCHHRPASGGVIGTPVPKRNFCALSKEDEDKERERVEGLSKYQKEMELRELEKEIKRLNVYRDINTGDRYTWRGRYKALIRDYGLGFVAWYWVVWTGAFAGCYVSIQFFGLDAMALIGKLDSFTGLSLASHIDPRLGNVAVALVANEALEPVRLPLVVMTTKPMVKWYSSRN